MSKARVTIRMTASLPHRVFEKEGWENARCDLLKVSGIGKTKRAALKNLKDSITLLFQGALEDGKLGLLLSNCGLEKSTHAGVTVWDAPQALAELYSDQEELEFSPKFL